MLLSEIIYNYKNLVQGGITSDDMNIRDSQFAFIISYYRAKLLKQDQDKGRLNLELYKQNLGKVNLIQADKNECCNVDACILRTELKIPSPLETNKGLNITFVGTLGGTPFQKEYHNTSIWSGASKWTGKDPTWYYQNGYIYIQNPPTELLKYINIQGVFERPEEAVSFRTCDCPDNNEECFNSYDFNYPLPEHHVDTIVKMMSDSELRLLTGIPKDSSNDGQDALTER